MTYTSFPLSINDKGIIAETDYSTHIYQMIEQFLFTAPGERVNRPTFGTGILQMVFGAATPEIAVALQFQLQASLQQWFGQLIRVENLQVTARESRIDILITYVILALKKRETHRFIKYYGGLLP